ncbi:MAG: tetratricopeptide repeat protein [Arenimonas sp.]
MTLFILAAAILVLIALGLASYPLIKTQRKLAITLIIALPLLTFSLYRFVGSPQALDNAFISENQKQLAPDINTAITNLQEELKSNPGNTEGWVLLARTHNAMGNFEEANSAFRKAISLDPGNPDLKAELAEAMLRSSKERTFPKEAIELLAQALTENPGHERALFFMGMNFLQQGDLAQAESYFDKLLPKLDTEAANALREQINIARAEQNKPPLQMAATEKNANAGRLKVTVSLDKSLASEIKPGAVLFVFAKSINGGGPPVAAKRIVINTFPVELELSDADSLMPTSNLSSQETVSISARISMQGIANAQTGDIEADPITSDSKNTKTIEIKLSRITQ